MLLGINALNHDASVCLVDNNQILFAGHAERYSRIKNDSNLNQQLLADCFSYGNPTKIVWYENTFTKTLRKIYSQQKPYAYSVKNYLKNFKLDHLPIIEVNHHHGHAAMAYYTSGFKDASILVVDGIGEWNTVTIWAANGNKLKCVKKINYPHSMGLFYTAATDAVGLKPNEEEYILMGMAAWGIPKHEEQLRELFFGSWDPPYFKLKHNLHKGMKRLLNFAYSDVDFAASVQSIFESYIIETCNKISVTMPSKNLIVSGGSALNCVANGLIIDNYQFDNVWVPPNPGDSGLALGSIAAYLSQPIEFNHAFLGHDIARTIDPKNIVEALLQKQIVGVANGRAEWGPRALGNRSLLADPRGPDVKDRVNQIKRRQKFRPFAPAILSEYADQYFLMDNNNHEYMQYTVVCQNSSDYPAIIHIDGTSRLQTVSKNSPSILRPILECWHERTGCPILLNTSLNIKGQPLVNTIKDAEDFEQYYGVRVF